MRFSTTLKCIRNRKSSIVHLSNFNGYQIMAYRRIFLHFNSIIYSILVAMLHFRKLMVNIWSLCLSWWKNYLATQLFKQHIESQEAVPVFPFCDSGTQHLKSLDLAIQSESMCGELTLSRMPDAHPDTLSLLLVIRTGRKYDEKLVVEIKTGRSLINYCHGQNNLIYSQLITV